jgi:hypothetical protein
MESPSTKYLENSSTHKKLESQMSTSFNRRLVWGSVVGVVLVIVFVLCVAYVSQLKDSEIAEAINRLQPGMTDAEVDQVLEPLRHVKVTKQGVGDFTFYGNDEFVTVVMEKDREHSRLAKVVHQPDLGPWWERFRRKWEWRLR